MPTLFRRLRGAQFLEKLEVSQQCVPIGGHVALQAGHLALSPERKLAREELLLILESLGVAVVIHHRQLQQQLARYISAPYLSRSDSISTRISSSAGLPWSSNRA